MDNAEDDITIEKYLEQREREDNSRGDELSQELAHKREYIKKRVMD